MDNYFKLLLDEVDYARTKKSLQFIEKKARTHLKTYNDPSISSAAKKDARKQYKIIIKHAKKRAKSLN